MKKNTKKLVFGQKKSNAIFGYYFFRIFAVRIAPYLVKIGVTANQATALSFILGILASILFIGGAYSYYLSGAIIYYFSKLFDYIDGEIARANNIKAKIGKWGDRYGDVFKIITPFFCIGLGLYLKNGKILFLILGLISVILFLLFMVTKTLQMIMLNLYRLSDFRISEKTHLGWTTPSSLFIMFFMIFNKPELLLWFFSTFGALPWFIKIYTSYTSIKRYDIEHNLK